MILGPSAPAPLMIEVDGVRFGLTTTSSSPQPSPAVADAGYFWLAKGMRPRDVLNTGLASGEFKECAIQRVTKLSSAPWLVQDFMASDPVEESMACQWLVGLDYVYDSVMCVSDSGECAFTCSF